MSFGKDGGKCGSTNTEAVFEKPHEISLFVG